MILAVYLGHGVFHPVAVLSFSKSVFGRGLKLPKTYHGEVVFAF